MKVAGLGGGEVKQAGVAEVDTWLRYNSTNTRPTCCSSFQGKSLKRMFLACSQTILISLAGTGKGRGFIMPMFSGFMQPREV
jgi:hypothetical protein